MRIVVVRRTMRGRELAFDKEPERLCDEPYIARAFAIESVHYPAGKRSCRHAAVHYLGSGKVVDDAVLSERRFAGNSLCFLWVYLFLREKFLIQIELVVYEVHYPLSFAKTGYQAFVSR